MDWGWQGMGERVESRCETLVQESVMKEMRRSLEVLHVVLLFILGVFCIEAPAVAHPLDPLARFWDRGSFDSQGESLQWHFEKHGREVGAADVTSYARKAESFYTSVRGDRWESGTPVPGETPYVRRFIRAIATSICT